MEKEKNKFHVTHHIVCQNDKSYEVVKSKLGKVRKSNLPTEHKQMHKFTKVVNGGRKQTSCHSSHFLSE